MIHPRVLFLGDPAAAAPYVGLAKKLARQTFNARIRSKTYKVGEATIRIENTLHAKGAFDKGFEQTFSGISKAWIQVGGSEAGYQFIGSGPFLDKTFLDPTVTGRHCPRGYAVWATIKNGSLIAYPLFSNVEADTQDPQRWNYIDPYLTLTQPELKVTPMHQPDGAGIRQWFAPIAKVDNVLDIQADQTWLMTTWAQGRPCSGMGANSILNLNDVFDDGFDYPPCRFTKPLGVIVRPETDWWRSSALYTATQDGETRVFQIVTDSSGAFYAFPTSLITPTLTQMSRADPPWPAWVTQMPIGATDGLTDEARSQALRPLWMFNPTGTEATCVTAARQIAWSAGAYRSQYYSPVDGALIREIQHDAPGIVRVGLSVSWTSSTDYNLTVTLISDESAVDSGDDWPIAVDFTSTQIGVIQQSSWVRIAYQTKMSSLDVQEFYNDGYGTISTTIPVNKPVRVAVLGKLQVYTNGVWTNLRQWLAYLSAPPLQSLGQPADLTPGLADFTELSTLPGSNPLYQTLEYAAQISSIDLSTLSIALCATASTTLTYSWMDNGINRTRQSSAEAALTEVWINNATIPELQFSAGHPVLEAALPGLLHLTTLIPDVENWPTVPWSSYISQSVAADGATSTTFTVPGSSTTQSFPQANIEILKDGSYGWTNILACPLFTTNNSVVAPGLFRQFDPNWALVRPGTIAGSSYPSDFSGLSFSGYPIGAILADNSIYRTMLALNNIQNRLTVHPNGSYSISWGPITVSSVLSTYISPANRPIPNSYQSIFLDRVVLKKKDGSDAVTTHIELLNQAFDKSWTIDDYYFVIRQTSPATTPQINPSSSDHINQWYSLWDNSLTWFSPGVMSCGFSVEAHLNTGGSFIYNALSGYSISGQNLLTKQYINYHPAYTFPLPRQEALFTYWKGI